MASEQAISSTSTFSAATCVTQSEKFGKFHELYTKQITVNVPTMSWTLAFYHEVVG
jgi:hypothetical protein